MEMTESAVIRYHGFIPDVFLFARCTKSPPLVAIRTGRCSRSKWQRLTATASVMPCCTTP